VAHTLRMFSVNKVRRLSEHDLLQDNSEAVDVSFLSSVDRSSCHTQQLRCCPQLITVIFKLTHLRNYKRLTISTFLYDNVTDNVRTH